MHWLLMKHVDMVNSLAKIKVELMNLLLEKVNDSVALNNKHRSLQSDPLDAEWFHPTV
jgi:hypothetical protein